MQSCKPPQCEYSQRWKKCVKPNPYIEALSWCKRNNIPNETCKKTYNSEEAKREACNRYEERMKYPSRLKSPLKSPKKSPKISTRKSISSSTKNKAALKITKFIKNYVLDRTETIENRIKYYNYVQHYLKHIPDDNHCLEAITLQDADGNIINAFQITDKLKLITQIGSKSVYGVIYKTAGKHIILSLASKLMPINKSNKYEAVLNMTTANLVLNKMTRHFLICYKTYSCKNKSKTVHLPSLLKNKSYYIVLNELAQGDLQTAMKNIEFLKDTKTLFNIMFQIFFSILTFHSLGYSHNDCHWGNFLYHTETPTSGAYYHYIIDNKNYYLQKCKYNMMIYDFGLARTKKILGTQKRILADYTRILNAFKNKTDNGWGTESTYPLATISKFSVNLTNIISGINSFDNEGKMFTDLILPHLLNCPYQDVLKTDISASQGEYIINKKNPYVIDKVHLKLPRINPFTTPLSQGDSSS